MKPNHPASTENQKEHDDASQLAEWTYPVMFYLSVAFLAILSTLLVLWIYVPITVDIDEAAEAAGEAAVDISKILTKDELLLEAAAYRWGVLCASVLSMMWPIFVAERLFDRLLRLKLGIPPSRLWWISCVAPPLRLCAHRRVIATGGKKEGEQIWFPRSGWRTVNRQLQRDLEKAFSLPMIFIALLILPVLGIQFYFASAKHNIVDFPVLRLLLNFGTGLIWFAFTTEFIVMVSVAEKKLAYCKKHWLDLIIILLPLISFLRTFSVLRATRLAKIGKLQQLSKLVRVYRLRGVSMRALRALMLLEVIHRLLKTKPAKRIKRLEEQYAEKQRELDFLAEEIERLKLVKRAADKEKLNNSEVG